MVRSVYTSIPMAGIRDDGSSRKQMYIFKASLVELLLLLLLKWKRMSFSILSILLQSTLFPLTCHWASLTLAHVGIWASTKEILVWIQRTVSFATTREIYKEDSMLLSGKIWLLFQPLSLNPPSPVTRPCLPILPVDSLTFLMAFGGCACPPRVWINQHFLWTDPDGKWA